MGEYDTISGMPGETIWTTSGGTLSTRGPSSGTVLTAPGVKGKVTVTATARDESVTIDFNVIEPDGISSSIRTSSGTQGQDAFNPPFVGAGMYIDVVLTPKTVSFYRVQIKEPPANATERKGYFETHAPPNHDRDHGADIWHPVNCENRVVDGEFDHAGSFNWPLNSSGSYKWPISPIWSINGSGPVHPLNGWTPQMHTLTSGTMKIEKLGHTVIRAQSQVIGTVQ